ncbi:MAG: Omp28-related outer membrane protein [Bacteroidota bacterium]
MKKFEMKKIAYYTFFGAITLLFSYCSKDDEEPETQQITGCKDPNAQNYNADADITDNSLCTYILGCTDPEATNYNKDATKNDDSCTYIVAGCMDPLSNNYDEGAEEDDGSCLYNCTDPLADNYNEEATTDNGTCGYSGSLTKQFTVNPEEYTRKILLEAIVGTWSGWSVDVPIRVEDLNDSYDDTIIPSYMYNGSGDLTNDEFYDYVYDTFDVIGFPSGMVNRRASIAASQDYTMPRTEWATNVDEQSAEAINTGLALSTLINDNDELEVFVEVGFNTDEEDVALHVHLLEDGIIKLQYNYYSSEYGDNNGIDHPFYDQPSEIDDYIHNNVFRESLTPHEGLSIPNSAIASNRKFQRMFKVEDLSNYDSTNLKIIAFVAKNGESLDQKYVLNVQKVLVNSDPGAVAVQDYD